MQATIEQTPKQRVETACAELGIAMAAVFVPWSKSRNKNEKSPSLNWSVTLTLPHGSLTTDYMAGSGHCPAYKASVKQMGGQNSMMRADAIRWECEHGKRVATMDGRSMWAALGHRHPALLPDLADVVYSLVQDSDVLEYATFEEWADSVGYEADSRAHEKIYRACLEIALRLRAGLGDGGISKLRDACQDY